MRVELRTVPAVLHAALTRPRELLVRQWNYKSALLSALTRAAIFFTVNLQAGLESAQAAAITEMGFRLVMSGFYGALTQSFRHVEPRWQGQVAAMILLPAAGHSLEFLVHWLHGTPELAASLAASVSFTALSTAFNLFAMQRGVFVVGEDARPLLDDLRAVPRLVALFVRQAVRSAVGA